jgi:hypothetical protein
VAPYKVAKWPICQWLMQGARYRAHAPATEKQEAGASEASERRLAATPRAGEIGRGDVGLARERMCSGPNGVGWPMKLFILFCLIFLPFHFQISNLNVDLAMNFTICQMFNFISLV